MTDIKTKVISFLQSFVANFFTTLGIIIITLPLETLMHPKAWTMSAIIGVVGGAVRSAVKKAWQSYMPVRMGGVEK